MSARCITTGDLGLSQYVGSSSTVARRPTIYLVSDFSERWPDLMASLGKHRASKACLYLTRLTGVDRSALRMLLERSLAETRSQERWSFGIYRGEPRPT